MGNLFEDCKFKSYSYCPNSETNKEEHDNSIEAEKTYKKRNKDITKSYQITKAESQEYEPKKHFDNLDDNIINFKTDKNTIQSDKDEEELNKEYDKINKNFNIDEIPSNDSEINESRDEKIIEEKKIENKKDMIISEIPKLNKHEKFFDKKEVSFIKKFSKVISSQIEIEDNGENGENIYLKNDNNNNKKNQTVNVIYEGQRGIFIGELIKENPLTGKGTLTLSSGEIYSGNLINGKLEHHGQYTDRNGNIYEGEFNNGKLSGKGKITQLEENKKTSRTNDILSNIKYSGIIKDFKREGFGNETTQEYTYEGNFHNDKKDGKGKLRYIKSGDIYEGEFKDGEPDGKGKYCHRNGNIYVGDFIKDKADGKGIFYCNNGDRYEGDFKKDAREGKGIFYFANGDRMMGDFHNNNPIGKHVILQKNGNVIEKIYN
jgi:hypothetical protein